MILFMLSFLTWEGNWFTRLYNKIFPRSRRGEHPWKLAFLCNGVRYFTYENYLSISNARRNQIDALMREEVQLNMTRKEQKTVSQTCHDYAQSAHGILYGKQRDIINTVNDPEATVDQCKAVMMQFLNLKDVLMAIKNIENIQMEVLKRQEMLTLFNVYARVCALCVWKKGEDPTKPLSPQDVEDRAALFVKKKVLAPLLRLPIANTMYQFTQSDEGSLQFLKLTILQHQQIADIKGLGNLGQSSQTTNATPPAKAS